ncbi:hypothetical protein [Cupriavidus agavae]|uniref:Uncharacterized protein n=1 Tax=Cupriavidus agavae TaxID=1001822 RepID=A0A4Q7S3M4_9BURK|nr:hypothetical protein [Cupriavidus agavae]RZT39422.1 hypothetical protein EV147_2617 [Cupriavidus agavae]
MLQKIRHQLQELSRRRREKWLQRDVVKAREKAYLEVFGLTTRQVQDWFDKPFDINFSSPMPTYPAFYLMDDEKIFAVSGAFQIPSDQAEAILKIAAQDYRVVGQNQYMQAEDSARRLLLWARPNHFNGTRIGITTNDLDVCRRVIAYRPSPLRPWEAFPELADYGIGFLQGNIEYWWLTDWDPYWDSLTPAEQEAFMTTVPAPWKAAFWRYCGEGRGLFEKRGN